MIHFNLYPELKHYIYKKECEFVKHKYGIKKLPWEIVADQRTVQPQSVLVSACNNVDFENGNFGGWTGSEGYNANSTLPLTVTNAVIAPGANNSAETSCSYQTIMSGAGTDPYGGFTVVDPGGGSYSCRLGGENLNLNAGLYKSLYGTPFLCSSE